MTKFCLQQRRFLNKKAYQYTFLQRNPELLHKHILYLKGKPQEVNYHCKSELIITEYTDNKYQVHDSKTKLRYRCRHY